MKAQNFRIGNLIKHDWIDKSGELKKIIPICGMMKNFVIVDDNRLPDYTNINQNKINPILLSDHFDFSIFDYLTWSYKYTYYFQIKKNNTLHISHSGGNLIFNDVYVHELQNIYFILTKEELKFKI